MKGVSIEVGKRGGEGKKMMNSGFRERERRKIKGKNVSAANCKDWFELKQKRSGSGLSTSPRTYCVKMNPLGRIQHSARAVSVSNRLFRPTLTDEWEVFRSPN